MRRIIDQVRDYVHYLNKPFTYKTLMNDLGIGEKSATTAIARLKDECLIIKIGRPREGFYHRASHAQQLELKATKLAAERKARIMNAMQPGIIYSTRCLRQLSDLNFSFSEICNLADAGLVEKRERKGSFYWVLTVGTKACNPGGTNA